MLTNAAFDVNAAIGLVREPSLHCQARTSENADFCWEDRGDTFTVCFSQDSLREFVRQATLMLAALETFQVMEENDEETGEFTVRDGADGKMITADELAERLRVRHPRPTATFAY